MQDVIDRPEPPQNDPVNEEYMKHLHSELREAYSCFVCIGFTVSEGLMIKAWFHDTPKDQFALIEAVRRWLDEQEAIQITARIYNYDEETGDEDE